MVVSRIQILQVVSLPVVRTGVKIHPNTASEMISERLFNKIFLGKHAPKPPTLCMFVDAHTTNAIPAYNSYLWAWEVARFQLGTGTRLEGEGGHPGSLPPAPCLECLSSNMEKEKDVIQVGSCVWLYVLMEKCSSGKYEESVC